jgi:hypothetical protein
VQKLVSVSRSDMPDQLTGKLFFRANTVWTFCIGMTLYSACGELKPAAHALIDLLFPLFVAEVAVNSFLMPFRFMAIRLGVTERASLLVLLIRRLQVNGRKNGKSEALP